MSVMDTRLEIASRVLAWMVHEYNSPDVAARESLYIADALLAAHAATAKPALPDDAPVMEWRIGIESGPTHRAVATPSDMGANALMYGPRENYAVNAAIDLPAVRAAAEAYSAAKGCKAVFVGEGAEHD